MNLRHRSRLVPVIIAFAACGGSGSSAPPAASAADAATSEPVVTDAAALVAALPNGAEPEPGIFTAGAPTREDLALAATVGVETVIDLRAASEQSFDEKAEVEGLGMHYVSIEVTGAGGLTRERAEQLDAALEGEGPFLVHCASSNRVGALFALRAAWLQGADEETAIEVGRAHGLTSLESAVREALQASE